MKKLTLLFSTILFSSVSAQQSTYTMTSDVPIVMTSLGTGTYNVTQFYHNNDGLLVDLAKKSDNIMAEPIDFKINARGGHHHFFTIKGNNGNVGVGVENPTAKLHIAGDILSSHNSNEGGSIILENPSKISSNIANKWVIYNMTGQYGNSLQFWNYSLGSSMYGSRLKLSDNGNMALYGKFEATEVKVTTTPTADFVFEKDYNLPTLEDVEKQIKEKKHLPEIASAKEMEKEGVNVGEFQIKLLQKIEELTLYVIEQKKQIQVLEAELNKIKNTTQNTK